LQLKYIIACSSRTGSTLLASELGFHGAFAEEHLNVGNVLAAKERGVTSLAQYVLQTIANGSDPRQWAVKGTFGLVEQLASLGERPHFHEWKFIFLTRDNLVRQAISLIIAQKSGRWGSWSRGGRAVAESEYDFAAIASTIDAIAAENSQWDRFFGAFAIRPLRMTYETLTADLESASARARDFLGLPDQRQPHCIEHRRRMMLQFGSTEDPAGWRPASQWSEINRAWEDRFRSEIVKR